MSSSCLVHQQGYSTIILCFSRSTEHVYDHVKDNLPAKLLRIQTFGRIKFKEFMDLIFVVNYKMCESKMDKNYT